MPLQAETLPHPQLRPARPKFQSHTLVPPIRSYTPAAKPVENFAEDPDEVRRIRCDFAVGACLLLELADARRGPCGVFDLLLLHQHLRRRLELLMLNQPVDKLRPRIILFF